MAAVGRYASAIAIGPAWRVMAFQRERFLLRCVAAVIGVRLLASLAVIVVCLGGWSASRKACGDALEGYGHRL